MNLKWIGTLIVIAGCGGAGFLFAATYRQQIKQIHQLLTVLDLFQSELEYRRTPLPELCCIAGCSCSGVLKTVFEKLFLELDSQIAPDACCCMNAVLQSVQLSTPVRGLFCDLGKSLGRFDLTGQIRGIEAVRRDGSMLLDKLIREQDKRLQSYQTLGLCAGASVAILLF